MPVDTFDRMLIHLCDVLIRTSGAENEYGQEPGGLDVVAQNVPCRFSDQGSGRETRAGQQASISMSKFFMRPMLISEQNWIKFNGQYYNVIYVRKPSGGAHHFEVIVELVTPSSMYEGS